MNTKRVLVVVRGRVQGVGFRASCQREALALGLTGWVRNRWDGSVEALIEGPENAVDALVSWCHEGPSMAGVTEVDVQSAPEGSGPTGRSFSVRFL